MSEGNLHGTDHNQSIHFKQLKFCPRGLGAEGESDLNSRNSIGRGAAFASDVLCNLWYCLPQTKAALAEAISGEYDRLTGVESILKAFVSSGAQDSILVARTAYEMVTVCSSLGNIGLPVEVLVSALDISYEEWAGYAREGNTVWGLIYDEESTSIESWVYRTRNHIVTEILMRHFNRNDTNHSHEFRTLLRLIKGCGGGAAPYRQFLFDVLVSNRDEIEKRFDLERAVELYETALDAYPRRLGKVEFHYLICKRNLGGDPLQVYDEMTKLISRSRVDPSEFDSPDLLQTSAAATMLRAYNEKTISAEDASEAIYRHVTQALGIAPHSFHATHTQANALLKIGADIRAENSKGSAENVIRAANIIERSLMSLDGENLHTRGDIDSYAMFSGLREEYLLALPDSENSQKELFDQYRETKSSIFLVLAAKSMLGRALKSGKGRAFKKAEACIDQAVILMEADGLAPEADLLSSRVQLNYEWKLRGGAGPVYWEQFRSDLEVIRSHRRYREDPLWDFLLGVAAFHLNDFSVSDQCFARLRARNLNLRFKKQQRAYYQGDSGSAKILEGRVLEGADARLYLYSSEIGTDIKAHDSSLRKSKEEIKFFKISFSMFGALAIPEK